MGGYELDLSVARSVGWCEPDWSAARSVGGYELDLSDTRSVGW